jgi:hypothetical protein
MAEAIDVYQSCPCGSGKKLKFCCHAILGEMQKIAEMQQHHQFQMALAALESLEKRNLKEVWSRAWVRTTRAMVHWSLRQSEQANLLVEQVLDELPEHPLAVLVYALQRLGSEGYPAAKQAIYAAFEVPRSNPALLSNVMRSLGLVLAMQGHGLAAREHLARAVLLDTESEETSEEFLTFDSDSNIPYAFRTHYMLAEVEGDEDLQSPFQEALRLATTACFSDAAKAFGILARQNPTQPAFWWNIALCHAWAGEDPLAVKAFTASAANQSDIEKAADCLLLAHLLQVPDEGARIERIVQKYKVASVGKLLTLLDRQPRYARIPRPVEQEDDDEIRPVASYQILDREPPAPLDSLTVDDIPIVVGQIQVFDGNRAGNTSASALVGTVGRDRLAPLTGEFVAVTGDEVSADGEPDVVGYLRPETVPLSIPWYLPAELSRTRAEALYRERFRKIIDEVWPNTPHRLLGGKTPLEAMQVPELKPALLAALLALDVHCEQHGSTLDLAPLRARLGLPPQAMMELNANDEVGELSALELRRLPIDRLSDVQLTIAANRLSRLGHSGMTAIAVEALLSRPAILEKSDIPSMYRLLFQLALRRFDVEASLKWLSLGKQVARSEKRPLEELLSWEIEELALRTRNAEDPGIPELAATLWNYYRPKLPDGDRIIAGILNELRIPGPWSAGSLVDSGMPLAEPVGAPGGLWTPDAQPAGGPSKIWLPGQQ